MTSRSIVLALCLITACGGPPASEPVDAGHDASVVVDAGGDAAIVDAEVVDAPIIDAQTVDAEIVDAGSPDAGPMVEGILTGTCGDIDTELLDPSPFLFENAIEFPVRLTEADLAHFTEGAREVLEGGTVGGSSDYSEAVSFEVLARCEGASLIASEPFIMYTDMAGTKTDLLVEIDGHRVGVSVTRAVYFPRDAPYPLTEATRLLTRKLEDIHASTANVVEAHRWVKQILHVIAYAPMHADMFRMAWEAADPTLRGDTILLVTISNGEDAFIYDNEL